MGASDALFPDAASIRSAYESREPESLTLEFKQKSDPSNPIPTKDDRRNIAKSVSAFANGSGGTIIFGVETEKLDGADAAKSAKPIDNIREFQKQFEGVIQTFISPELASWTCRVVEDVDGMGRGFLVCEIQTSTDRPHMSIATGEHTFYRRTFQGDVPMTPLEVREQMLAVRDAQLELLIRRGGSTVSSKFSCVTVKADFSLILRNSGSRMAKNPFIRVSSKPAMGSYAHCDPLSGKHRTEFPTGSILHVGDSLPALSLYVSALVRHGDLYSGIFQRRPERCEKLYKDIRYS